MAIRAMKLPAWVKKYRVVIFVALLGVALMCLPNGRTETSASIVQEQAAESMEARLERILSRIDGAGEVAVMLTEENGEEVVYQMDDDTDTVLVTDANRNEQGLVRTREPPVYRGAVIVCRGADNGSVRLAIVNAVANVTGLRSDKISVLKMK